MVVDDSEVVLEMTRSALDAAGYHVVVRNRPSGSIAAMLQEEPDLVLVDVSMPGIGGDTLVRCFGTAHPNSRTIVLLYSSLPEEALSAKATASGAHGYIQKTHDPARLVRQVRRWLDPNVSSGTFVKAGNARSDPGKTQKGEEAPANSGTTATHAGRVAIEDTAPRVLLADADMLVLSQYRQHLGSERLRFDFALSGNHALELLTSDTPPDAAVLGLDLGDLPGEEVYERLASRDASWRDRVVLVVEPQQQPRVPYFARGVVRRPVNGAELRVAVEQALAGALRAAKSASG